MFVKRQRSPDVQAFHDDFAGTISKTPTAAGIITKKCPGIAKIRFRNHVESHPAEIEELPAEGDRTVLLTASAQQCQDFINDVIGCEQRAVILANPRQGLHMPGIGGNNYRVPWACVHKNAHGFFGSP